MGENYVPMEVVSISTSFSKRNGYSVVLKEIVGNRKIQMLVGAFEAQAIAVALENIITPRPLTHHFIQNILNEYEINLKYVVIYKFDEGIYYAQSVMEDSFGTNKSLDCRPSDAICLALKMDKPILATEAVFDESDQQTMELKEMTLTPKSSSTSYQDLTLPQLQEKLSKAIELENFEEAEQIKEEINRRKKP